jgi:hypothetical protein
MAQDNKIKIRRGNNASIPAGATEAGELRYSIDTKELYIDDGSANVKIGGNPDDFPVSTAQATAINAIKHIDVMIDGNGFVITNGVKTPYKFVPVSGTITGWDILASNSDSFSIDILYNSTFSSAPASITGTGTKPNVSASASGSGTDLTDWGTTILAKGGILAFQVAGTPAAATWAVMRIRIS